jgi:hypothetical protein
LVPQNGSKNAVARDRVIARVALYLCCHVANAETLVQHLARHNARRHPLEQHVDCFMQKKPSTWQHPQADTDRDDAVNNRSSGEAYDNSGADHPNRPRQITPHLEIGILDVEALILTGRQYPHRENIDCQTDQRTIRMAIDWISEDAFSLR